MTARYNIYFNGYESFKAGVHKVNSAHVDDYADILNVFEYSDPATPARCASEMERAIQKASKLITLKSITAKPEGGSNTKEPAGIEESVAGRQEYNEWVDDSYLLIGMARFYKNEFKEAAAVLNYCITAANDPDIRKEATIWLSRLYNETGKYAESYRALTELETGGNTSRSLRSMYHATLADLFVKQKKYAEAVNPLSSAIRLTRGKIPRYRLTYLLAQLNEQAGNAAEAISLYRDVVRMNPPYEVEFNARVNMAGVFDVNTGNSGEIMKELGRMLKDDKNKSFHDQIYFTMGKLAMKNGNESEALLFFRKSASASTSNINQKWRSYLALADYYFSRNDFVNASSYYDSTVNFMDRKHPDYKMLQLKSKNLGSVVSELSVIQKEDSLQRVAAMPVKERDALIASIINKAVRAGEEGRKTDYSDRYNLGQYYENERRFQDNVQQEGKWYFYNQTALAFGRSEFRRRWGDRRLEDNWRRSNKVTLAAGSATEDDDRTPINGSDTSEALLDYKKPEFYLKNLPLTDSMLALSNEKIAYAYLNAGKAYFEKLSDVPGATGSFEKLISRFPGNELVPEALYNLYNINRNVNGTASEMYRQRLIEKYPSTEFARILSDPGYFDKMMAEARLTEQLYNQAYNNYKSENFDASIKLCNDAMTKNGQSGLAPKFMLLRAYCIARISDEKTFKNELKDIVTRWPDSEESKKAGEIILFLDQQMPGLKVEEEKEIARDLFIADTTVTDIFALVIADGSFNMNQASFDVISYNIDNFTNKNYKTEGVLVDNQFIIITVSGFPGYSSALGYYKEFVKHGPVRNPSNASMLPFVISRANLEILNKDKNPGRYLLFFKENYLK
jgi:tetratricopeptide (TPR) repeat protein